MPPGSLTHELFSAGPRVAAASFILRRRRSTCWIISRLFTRRKQEHIYPREHTLPSCQPPGYKFIAFLYFRRCFYRFESGLVTCGRLLLVDASDCEL
jgi:hypothetical protein